MPEAEQGMNVARIALLLAGLPDRVPGFLSRRRRSPSTGSVHRAWRQSLSLPSGSCAASRMPSSRGAPSR
jgi:hypothetical protein